MSDFAVELTKVEVEDLIHACWVTRDEGYIRGDDSPWEVLIDKLETILSQKAPADEGGKPAE